MMIVETLELAQGGKMLERVAAATGFSPSDARKSLDALCPAIAARVRETADTPKALENLLSILDDNGGDLLKEGDVASGEVASDGRTVLTEAYGSSAAAQAEAAKVAQALRVDPSAIQKLLPIAAALVLAVLGKRYREVAGPGEGGAGDPPSKATAPAESEPQPSARGGLLMAVLVTAGAAAARAIVNWMLPRRHSYGAPYGYAPRRRRRRRREPTLNDLFRGLLR